MAPIKRNTNFRKKNYYNSLTDPTIEQEPNPEPEIPLTYLKAFEKSIESLANPIFIEPTIIKIEESQETSNNLFIKPVLEPIINTNEVTEEIKTFSLTDEEYLRHVICKLNPSHSLSFKSTIVPEFELISENPSIATKHITENLIQNKPISDTPENNINIINLFKERNKLETIILNSLLFDVNLLKALHDAFNKKLCNLGG